jgi:hypothetical protein
MKCCQPFSVSVPPSGLQMRYLLLNGFIQLLTSWSVCDCFGSDTNCTYFLCERTLYMIYMHLELSNIMKHSLLFAQRERLKWDITFFCWQNSKVSVFLLNYLFSPDLSPYLSTLNFVKEWA